jgi:hypothetical protein
MRCTACDVILDSYDLARRDRETDLFLDVCQNCLAFEADGTYEVDLDVDITINEMQGDSPWLIQQ